MLDLVKAVLSLVTAVLPFVAKKFGILIFINPRIEQELWPVTAIMAAVVGFASFAGVWHVVNRAPRLQVGRKVPYLIPSIGIFVATVCIAAMILLSEQVILSDAPGAAQAVVKLTYVFLFWGLAMAVGGALGLTSRREPCNPS